MAGDGRRTLTQLTSSLALCVAHGLREGLSDPLLRLTTPLPPDPMKGSATCSAGRRATAGKAVEDGGGMRAAGGQELLHGSDAASHSCKRLHVWCQERKCWRSKCVVFGTGNQA